MEHRIEHRTEYQILLNRFAGNNDLYKLLEECLLEEERQRESTYMMSGVYPERRNTVMKLMTDLKFNEEREVK
ncbi:hypothetical protein HMPREF0946_00810 [Fusobacterium vincentii 3_1_36A2]|jgi:hypothetical protein|uniref:Uncharacterized protein n=2 Tax=Fusobacterium TaxID=848 RepID=A0A0M4RWU6_9FUSO|nr:MULTISPECIES: hypothetical protein [Fusobacterium]DAN33489.1 MAG TPA: hypothetical protein [Caudoviricetes sp.]ALF17408.1 hypothetical protein RN98_04205 [Fusobacterium animalis]EEU32737.1 hypothetical protein HMPREF0946_00810 [Fusobacterium vincentii 3_1_36A2]DAR10495.1 MAG TPA: hypothetical protein [Caudoviricetes sp.]DAS14768.1 MAG TPA: hypothetical protein [Caudoviricetes sp.]